MPTNYLRVLPPHAQGEDAADYLTPREVEDPDEAAIIESLQRAIVGDTLRLPRGRGKDDAAFHEPHWGHTTGLLQGTLEIDRVEALPERFRVGLFAKPGSYPAVCRPNFIVDKKAGLNAARMAIKLKYPSAVPNVYAPGGQAHELDLLLIEGSPDKNGEGHAFFLSNAREFALIASLAKPSLQSLGQLFSLDNLKVLAGALKRLRKTVGFTKQPAAAHSGWAGKHYFGAGPFKLGDGAMKISLRPRQAHALAPANGSSDPTERARAAREAWMAAGQDAVFDLCVQLATADCVPDPGPNDPSKSVAIAELCDLQWDEDRSPYIPVGTLTLPARAQSDLSAQYPWSPLQFNAWNTLPSMQPLGQIFRARKHVHKAHCETRLAHVYEAEPGATVDRAPFSG